MIDYRPTAARWVSYAAGACLVVMFVAVAWAIPEESRESVDWTQFVTLLLVLGASLGILHGIARSRVQADEAELVVTNGYRRRVFAWTQILAVDMPTGAPWATIDLDDGSTVGLLAVQSADGDRSRAVARQLRALSRG